jgi:hypothetical protein
MGLNGFGERSLLSSIIASHFRLDPVFLNRSFEVASRPLLGRLIVGRISRQVSVFLNATALALGYHRRATSHRGAFRGNLT